ncbi:hypothetical protein QBC36DRAFT_187313 [Triangularia setosa]|uniref:Zn(2)-C6 fungal-type domain-containing protein n=1 Tax=Triangularia setosa TaxID=2587417 RepID=A0AAN7A723_9PEZI|nr:hypothetical protein QBC36DRAFT_187313 [Podospora setosa]
MIDYGHSGEPTRKRLRTSHACDLCRARKIRCDGKDPCAACAATENDCTYGSEANSRGKSDLILDGVLRVESFLQQMNANLISLQSMTTLVRTTSTRTTSFSGSPLGEIHTCLQPHSRQRTRSVGQVGMSPTTTTPNELENAVLESWHTSTTESVLHWPHFNAFPSLRQQYVPIFELEKSRALLRVKSRWPQHASNITTNDEVDATCEAFSQNFNFWYPTMSLHQLAEARKIVLSGSYEEENTPEACLALLTMALGYASQVTSGLVTTSRVLHQKEKEDKAFARSKGDMFFEKALKMLYVAHTDVSSIATQCLFFTAIYFAFLRRPLQAWQYISSAASKCLLLLSYSTSSHPDSSSYTPSPNSSLPIPTITNSDDQERTKRIFWACYILESDYLAELSHVPLSGIARIESSVPLPADAYHTHELPKDEELSSLYFLACISMRRLLNRVHQLLYAKDTGAGMDINRFPYVVAELDHQLEEWREVLPCAFAFEVPEIDPQQRTKPVGQKGEHGRFLRQRYLTCRSVIYRPYLMWMLSGHCLSLSDNGAGDISPTATPNHGILRNCRSCLDACLLHILNLRGFPQTVLVDTWICSLSMAGAMLVLLAACQIPSLRNLIGPEVLAAGDHLTQLLERWQEVSGGPISPSVDQSVRIIKEADRFIRDVYAADW